MAEGVATLRDAVCCVCHSLSLYVWFRGRVGEFIFTDIKSITQESKHPSTSASRSRLSFSPLSMTQKTNNPELNERMRDIIRLLVKYVL